MALGERFVGAPRSRCSAATSSRRATAATTGRKRTRGARRRAEHAPLSRARRGADAGGVETGVRHGSRRVRLVGPPRMVCTPWARSSLPDRAQCADAARRRRRGAISGPPPIHDRVVCRRARARSDGDELPGGFLGTRRAALRARDPKACAVHALLHRRVPPLADAAVPSSSRRSSPPSSPPPSPRATERSGLTALPPSLLGAVLVVQPTALFPAGAPPPRRRRRRGGRADRLRRNLKVAVRPSRAASSWRRGCHPPPRRASRSQNPIRAEGAPGKGTPFGDDVAHEHGGGDGGWVRGVPPGRRGGRDGETFFTPVRRGGAPAPRQRALLLTLAPPGLARGACITAALGRAREWDALHYTAVAGGAAGADDARETPGLEATGIGSSPASPHRDVEADEDGERAGDGNDGDTWGVG